MHMKPYYVIKRDDDDDEDEDIEIHHHHHYHHGHHPDTMGVIHHDSYAGEHGTTMAHVKSRMENPPHTWAAYHDKPGGMMSIVEMEYRELMEKKTEGSTSGIEKELTDLAAACICALKKMKAM